MAADVSTFFTEVKHPMLPVPENGDIEVESFLSAAREILPFFDTIGTAFIPVRTDIEGNIHKLEKKHRTSPEKYKTFRVMLEEEVEQNLSRSSSSATVSLLWLKRALQFMCEFFRLVLEDHAAGRDSENLGGHCRAAYERCLKPYHGWLVQKIFSVVSRALPYRRDLLRALARGNHGHDLLILNQMQDYLNPLKSNVDAIQELYDKLQLDFSDKV